jgi:iron complex outermembrane receptor protein
MGYTTMLNGNPVFYRTALATAAVTTTALVTFAPIANAQQSASTQIEEVLVTARKRVESLQEVPDSITAFSATQIEERRMDRIADAIALTPNVHIIEDQDAATNIITVRGIGTNRNLAAAVAYVVDGVILPDSDAFTADLSDVERIEILKGPQGALYGRNAIAGVINLTTKRPTADWQGELKAGYSSGEAVDLFGAVSGPVVGDSVLARATVKYHESDGLIDNTLTGRPLDHDRNVKTTLRLLWEANDQLTFDLRGSYFDQESGALWFSPGNVLDTTGGKITADMARLRPSQDDPGFTERTVTDLSLTADYEASFGTFTSITAYDDIDVLFGEDLDITALRVTHNTRQSRQTSGLSQELRFTSPAERRLRYIVGSYYQQTQRDVATSTALDFCFFVPLPFCPTPPGTVSGILVPQNLNTTQSDFDQWAVFAQASYDFTEALEISLALRYDEDRRQQLDNLTGREDQATFSDLQPKVSLGWKLSSDVMLYSTYAEGYKSGAFNPPPGPGAGFPLVVDQEGTDNYELGIKSAWFDNQLRVNASVYLTEYENAQIFQLDLTTGGQVATNANEAEIKGAELEVVAFLAEGLELTAGYGYTDARFTDFNGSGLYDDNRLPNAPRYGLNAGLRYSRPVGNTITLVTQADYLRNGTIYYSENNLVYQPSYHTVDAQIGLDGGTWSFTVWGKNVLDQNYVTSAYARTISPLIFGALQIDPYQIDPGASYGVEFRWRFGDKR